MRIIVYTANIGHYDNVELPAFKSRNPNVDFILFTTDLKFRSNEWEVRYIDHPGDIHIDNQRVARYFKLQPHKVLPNHDYNIWFDSCLSLKIPNYLEFIENNLIVRGLDMVSYRHPKRNCLYDEAASCMSQGLDNGITIKRQMESYKKEGFPLNYGLFDTGLLLRANTTKVAEFHNLWYKELKSKSKRDQLSHSYVLWKNQLKIAPFLEGVNKGRSPFLKKRKHIIPRLNSKGIGKILKSDSELAVEVMNRKLAYKMRNRT